MADPADSKDREYYARIASDYFRRQSQPIQRFSTQIESIWLRREIRPNSRVLLVGVGGGREIEPLLERGCQITAIDYSPEMLDAGRVQWERQAIDWAVADAHDLRNYRDRFDAVICLAALNYFVDPPKAMQAMADTLVKGGVLIVSSINAAHATERGYVPKPGYHRTLFDPASLRRLAEDAGLEPCSVRGIRVFADCLPASWNKQGATRLQSLLLRTELAIEPILQPIFGPARSKFLWLIASRP